MGPTQEQASDSAYRAIFEGAPIALWDEDFSGVKSYLDHLVCSGVADVAEHLGEHPGAVLECVKRVRVRHVNRIARDFYGARTEQQLIAALPSLFDATALSVFSDELVAFIRGASTFEAEFPVSTLAGERRQVVMNVSMLGSPTPDWSTVVVAFTDITERRRLEQTLQRANESLRRVNRHLEQFAYAAAHDMREPLRTIGLYAQLLQRHRPAEPDSRADLALKHILNNASRMETLVADLLQFARAVEPQLNESAPLETDARTVISETLSGISLDSQEAGARIHVATDLPVVAMQAVHLSQVFQNLLSNAIKYRAPGRSLDIRITAETTAAGATFCVADNGIGIKHDYQEQIFGIFKRLHGQEIAGNGIGLALCRKIVEDYGGRIWVESEPDAGARFYFTVAGAWR